MIGNKILFKSWVSYEYDFCEKEGIVVDAWTEVTGTIKGDVFIGIGDVKGETKSKRVYKVEYKKYVDSKHVYYENIKDWQMIKII